MNCQAIKMMAAMVMVKATTMTWKCWCHLFNLEPHRSTCQRTSMLEVLRTSLETWHPLLLTPIKVPMPQSQASSVLTTIRRKILSSFSSRTIFFNNLEWVLRFQTIQVVNGRNRSTRFPREKSYRERCSLIIALVNWRLWSTKTKPCKFLWKFWLF
jgi:hypothetical protein